VSEIEPHSPVLEFCSGCEEQLDVTAFGPFSKVVCPLCGSETRVKRQLGNYYLERRYAIGGMSVVYLATDQTLDREVAVKVLNEAYSADEVRVAAFENEARLTAAVNHPNVVQVYTVGRAHERFYLVMEMLPGKSFEAVMAERGALPESEVLDIALQVTEGLRAANDAGVLHRDVKPGNILLTSDGRAKLVDFGLALITKGGSATADEIWATPYYVPPEALDHRAEDFRSDLYALGASLYHAFVGKPPFESTSNSTKILRRAKQTIPRLGKVAPWLADETCEAIDRMMAYQPKHRWGSYEEVLAILHRARSVASDASGIDGVKNRAQRRVAKNPWLLPAALTAGVAATAALILLKPGEKEPEKQAVLEPKSAEIQPVEDTFDANRHLIEAWSSARSLVSEKKFRQAEKKFLELSEDPALAEPTRSFAVIEAGISASLDGRPGEARKRALVIHRHLKKLTPRNEVAEKLTHLTQVLGRVQPPPPADLAAEPSGIVGWMSLTALALKLWDQGLIPESVPLFEKILSAPIQSEFEWFSVYQKQAEDYLHDARLLIESDKNDLPSTRDEALAQLSDLAEGLGQIRTKGRARFNIRSKQIYLTRVRKGLELRPENLADLSLSERVSKVKEHAQACRFKAARDLIFPKDLDEEAATALAWTYLLEKASAFLGELEKITPWETTTRAGELFKVIAASEIGIDTDEGKRFAWSELDPESLLTIHRESPMADRLALREQAIAFAWLSGLHEEAEAEAEELAAESSAFSKRWRKVLVGISR